jgi:hypothetical protein
MAGFGKNTLAVIEILLGERRQLGVVLESMGRNGSRGAQLGDSLTECSGQHADTGPGIEQDVLARNRPEETGHEPGDFRRGEHLATLLAAVGGNALLESVLEV